MKNRSLGIRMLGSGGWITRGIIRDRRSKMIMIRIQMKTYFDGSILHFLTDLITKLPFGPGFFVCKIWMVSSVALNTYTPALFRHPKYESPTLFRIQISICEHQQTLILPQFDILFQIIKNLTCMKLLNLCIGTHSRRHSSLFL